MDQSQQQVGPTFNGGTAPGPIRNNPMNNKVTRGLPSVFPDPGVQPGNMMMNTNPNNYNNQMNTAVPQPHTTAAAPTSHFSFFGHHTNSGQQQQQQQQHQTTGPSLIQKMMGGGNTAAPSTTTGENPVEGLLSKGKDLIFKKFGLWVSLLHNLPAIV